MAEKKSTTAQRRKAQKQHRVVPVEDYEHSDATRKNNPPAGLAHLDRDETPVRDLSYDPHLDPCLDWAGKAEHQEVEIPAPSIHVHEELSAQKIVGSMRRQRLQASLFDVDKLDPDKAVDFYQHDLEWSNRMILGDSLMVMASLLDRERMAGQVQCVFMDPPYGIKYGSNFQPGIGRRNVTDGKDDHLTREPEMIQAYRDTWEMGEHSYLTYLRDRFAIARELLADSGSIFLQIGEENVHRVRLLLDEVFGSDNYVSQITFKTTSGAGSPGELTTIPATSNYLVWYAKDRANYKYRPLFLPKSSGRSTEVAYSWIELPDGSRRSMTKEEKASRDQIPAGSRILRRDQFTSQSGGPTTRFPIELEGVEYSPGRGYWKTNSEGAERLKESNRLIGYGKTLGYVRYLDDFDAVPLSNVWDDTLTAGFASDKRYVVQTNPKVVTRCLLMASDPGDLVLDPTCGSGTTAVAAEQYGRRWITIDTSRIAMAIARERLLTSIYPYYRLRDAGRDIDGGLQYKKLQRVTLRSIARGEDPEEVVLVDQPEEDSSKIRVSGPFTSEALSRYAVNPLDESDPEGEPDLGTHSHLSVLLDALKAQGIPRPGSKPAKIESLTELSAVGTLHAEGVYLAGKKKHRFAVSIGPRFGTVTMAHVSEALREAIGFDLVVFAGFAFSADAQEKLGSGRIGTSNVALLMANPDLLVGDLLKNTSSSQTFRLFSSPDITLDREDDDYRVTVTGVDSYDAATGEVTSFGQHGVQAWFLDDDYDGSVFQVSQAFFPVTDGWQKLKKALGGTVDAELVDQLHSWTSLPFAKGDSGRIAVRVITDDGNASEVVEDLP